MSSAEHADGIDVLAVDGKVVVSTEDGFLVLTAEAALVVAPALIAASREALAQALAQRETEEEQYFVFYSDDWCSK